VDADLNNFWRLDFHKIEARILEGYPKTIIRLLKVVPIGI
jgi:hypothetical protein